MTTQDTWPSLVPGDQMQPFQDIWNTLSRRSIFPVADNTERDDVLVPWLATKGMEAPSADNPLYVHNKAQPVGAQLQSSVDGSAWVTHYANGPFAVAAGVTPNLTPGGFRAVTFPSGRFTHPPIVTAQVTSASGSAIGASALILNVTTSGFDLRPEAGTSVAWHWHAIQVTPTSGAG
ncbi:hypothetical protein [Demequina globuliformis]|uniref:hypothetical protein n=1 Tax=Demequina globuliformis TaxID=676202 RepID=UPI000780AA06|nr:hypothetical protein [Demequina globuliformis]